MPDSRRLKDLAGIGKAALQDLLRLNVTSVEQLASCDAQELYARLAQLDGRPHDRCVLDVFSCAIAQARDPHLPDEQRRWWWWSQQRKDAQAAALRNQPPG